MENEKELASNDSEKVEEIREYIIEEGDEIVIGDEVVILKKDGSFVDKQGNAVTVVIQDEPTESSEMNDIYSETIAEHEETIIATNQIAQPDEDVMDQSAQPEDGMGQSAEDTMDQSAEPDEKNVEPHATDLPNLDSLVHEAGSSNSNHCQNSNSKTKENSSDSNTPQINHHELSATKPVPNEIPPHMVDKLTCRFCLKMFPNTDDKIQHCRLVHKVESDEPVSRIKCFECNKTFIRLQLLRDHLSELHKFKMNHQEFLFPNMDAFKKWKHDVERKELVYFNMRQKHAFQKKQAFQRKRKPRRKTDLRSKILYSCHLSGKYDSKFKNMHRQRNPPKSKKLGIECTAAIHLEECENEVHVKYYPYHYGHGKETLPVQLSSEEQAAIQENVSKGIPFESLLNSLKDGQSTNEHFQVGLLKRRDIHFINNAFKVADYNNGISDEDSINLWVQQCCQMEDSPIHFYRQEDTNEDFTLVIMTEFQKQMLISSERQVVCIDSLYRQPKGGRFYLTIIFTMDECEMAFPVAYCISSKVDKYVMVQFLTSIRDSTGPLTCQYFMSDSEDFHYSAWVEVMGDTNCRWLWSTWYVDNAIRTQLSKNKFNIMKRAELYKKVKIVLECQNMNLFNTLLKNYVEQLLTDDSTKPFGQFIMNKYGSNTEMWAHCHRQEIKLSTNVHLEMIHRTFKYTCREGRKKRLDKFISVIMKLLRYKMLDRLANMLDEEKINMAVEAINNCHNAGLEITAGRISSLSDSMWLIRSEDEGDVFIVREFESCPEHCTLRCSECDICVHMYSCSCVQNMINANLCHHIHAVVWKFVTPHFSPPVSPAADNSNTNDYDDVNNEPPVLPDKSSELLQSLLKRIHDVYKKVRSSTLNRQALTTIMNMQNKCIDVCNGKLPEMPEDEPSEQPPSPPSLPISFLQVPQSPQSLVHLPTSTSQQPIQLSSPNVVYVINQYGRKPLETSFLQSQLANIVQGNKTSQVPQ